MKKLIAVLMLASCATVGPNPYAYEEAASCPRGMTEDEHLSGTVRCRALCSSYGRDFDQYGKDCRCFCRPSAGAAPVYRNQL